MDVRGMTGGLNYEAEYHRLTAVIEKLNVENEKLRRELNFAEKELAECRGFRTAIEMIYKDGKYDEC